MVEDIATATNSGRRLNAIGSARVPQLDGLRAIAILLVLIWHYYVRRVSFQAGGFVQWLNEGLGLTWSGVDLFFVLSGFLIGGILLDNARSERYYSTFYIRRSCRILPIYFIFILPLLIVPMLEVPDRFRALATALEQPFSPWLYPPFLQNFGMAWVGQLPSYSGVTWSLAIEEQFYLVLPFVLHRMDRARIPWLCTIGIAVAIAARLIVTDAFGDRGTLISYVLLPTRCDSLLAGVLCAWLLRSPKSLEWLKTHAPKLRVVCGLAAAGYVALGFTRSYASTFMTTIGYTLLAGFYALVLLVAVTLPGSALSRVLSMRLFVPIATVSYAVYLIHIPVENALHQFIFHRRPQLATWADAAVQAGALATTFFIAAISWFLLERRLIRFGHKYRY